MLSPSSQAEILSIVVENSSLNYLGSGSQSKDSTFSEFVFLFFSDNFSVLGFISYAFLSQSLEVIVDNVMQFMKGGAALIQKVGVSGFVVRAWQWSSVSSW